MKTQSRTRTIIKLSYFLASSNPVPVRIQSTERPTRSARHRRPNFDLTGHDDLMLCDTCAGLGYNRCERHYHRVGLIRQPQMPCAF